MFNTYPINTLEVNGGPILPDPPVLSINPGEDINTLTWNSPYYTDFQKLYWSTSPFDSIDDPGVHVIDESFGVNFSAETSYDHVIPGAFSLSILYYRVSAENSYGIILSNQVDNYNLKLAIYEALYNKTLDELTLRFTPEIRRQYQDSILWRSFVQSLCSELAQSRFEIKEALKQLNLQKAISVFLNIWTDITGMSRLNNIDPVTGNPVLETDIEYRQRLVDNIFWDKVSNNALKKTMLLKVGYDATVVDQGVDPEFFREVPELFSPKYLSNYGARFLPTANIATPLNLRSTHGSIPIQFLRLGRNSIAEVVADSSTESSAGTLTYTNYVWNYAGGGGSGPPTNPVYSFLQATQPLAPADYSLFWLFADAYSYDQPGTSDINDPATATITHGPVSLLFQGAPSNTRPGDALSFWPSGATGTLVSASDGAMIFELTPGSVPVRQWDWVRTPDYAEFATPGRTNWLLTEEPILVKSTDVGIHPKLLSNIYSVNVGVTSLSDAELDRIYDEISPLGALGNVLIKIVQDLILVLSDWDPSLGNIPYGAIFMGVELGSGAKSTESNWSVGEDIYLTNEWDMSSGRTFYGNPEPDDIITLTRTS